jgi:hypothetical protein
MKFLLVLLFIITFSNAETIFNRKCVDYFYIKDSILSLKYSDATVESVIFLISKSTIQDLATNINKFHYDSDNDSCVLNIEDTNYIFLMSLTGLICGTLISSVILFKVT